MAGLVQSTSTLNPYINPDGALVRRNLVLDTMIEQLARQGGRVAGRQTDSRSASWPGPTNCHAAASPPATGRSSATTSQEYLARAGLSKEQVARGGYLIKTTLDPDVQADVKKSVDSFAAPDLTASPA